MSSCRSCVLFSEKKLHVVMIKIHPSTQLQSVSRQSPGNVPMRRRVSCFHLPARLPKDVHG